MLKVILIDDEVDSLNALEIELNHLYPNIKILAKFQNPKEAVQQVLTLNPDLIFLDIGMPHMDGFEFLQQFDTRPFDVIFVTAYEDYAIRAFEFNATAYLLKPIMEHKLKEAIEKVIEEKEHGFPDVKLNALLNHLNIQRNDSVRTLALPIGEGYEFVNYDMICYLEADNNYTWVHITNNSKHLICKTLKEMESIINRNDFFRVHKSYLINLNCIIQYIRTDGGQVVMNNNDRIPVSRRKKEELKRKLNIV